MKYLFLSLILLGAGCTASPLSETAPEVSVISESETTSSPDRVGLPVENYVNGRTMKVFGEYIEDRFKGYHVGDDVEVIDKKREMPVMAIAEGVVRQVSRTSGYGGLVIIDHLNGQPDAVTALYGHLDLSSVSLKEGETVSLGDFIGNLGDDASEETDGERKHLHFALYPGGDARVAGYELKEEDIDRWINPTDFFTSYMGDFTSRPRVFSPEKDLGGNIYRLTFAIPEGWEVEYIPSLKALNLFTLNGQGSARDRSQLLIRHFDAVDFLTLSTVTIHKSTDLNLGTEDYTARRYDIEKKPNVPNFLDQPAWRNERHVVTDFRDKSGFTRYYVVAANPELSQNVYEEILDSMKIIEPPTLD
ncbi:MAG: M23 family metallopeptidase [bacterium]|nr:M23 family metallopeptidase [bacterium]